MANHTGCLERVNKQKSVHCFVVVVVVVALVKTNESW
jgi:hypothetical protein